MKTNPILEELTELSDRLTADSDRALASGDGYKAKRLDDQRQGVHMAINLIKETTPSTNGVRGAA